MCKQKFALAVLAFSVFSLLSSRALAQDAPTPTNDAGNVDQIRRDSRIHVGPFYVTPTVLLKNAGVDTNVFNQSGDQKSDFTVTLAPQADIAIPIARRGLFRTTVGTDLVYYATYDSERSIDPFVHARGEAYAHRLTLFADESYLNTRQRPNYEIDLRSRHLENDLLAGAELRLTPRLSVEIAGRRAITQYDADAFFDGTRLQQTLDRTTTGGVGTVRFRLTPLTTFGVKGDSLQDDFTYSPERNSRSFRVMPGVEFKPRALVSGYAWVGYREFTPDQPAVLPQFSGLVADLGLSYTLLGSTTFGVSYHRDLTYSYEVDDPFFVDNSVGGSIRRALGGRFDAIASIDRHVYAYERLLTLPSGPDRTDTTWVYGANVGYRFRRQGRIGFGANYYQRESTTVRLVQYDGLRFGVTVNYGF
jgi:hypothetical protein